MVTLIFILSKVFLILSFFNLKLHFILYSIEVDFLLLISIQNNKLNVNSRFLEKKL